MTPATAMKIESPIHALEVRAYRVPTEQQPQESDGTLCWSSTTLVLVEVNAAGVTGIGYTYADASAATLIDGLLKETVLGKDALDTAARYADMCAAVRNNGREGITAMAISAVDIALWDLKGKVLDAPVSVLFGAARSHIPIYGSGGFTSYAEPRLREQLAHWVHEMGIPRVKMKVGRDPGADAARVAFARNVIGTDAQLFVDANGAYNRKQALEMAQHFAQQSVTWFEEPVDHNDLDGNRFVRDHAPAGMEISNGEYGFALFNFHRLIESGAADVVQADVTRCGGYSGFLEVDALCRARNIPLSSHCAPYLTVPAASAAQMLRHVEFFYDHVRIERMFFDGTDDPVNGELVADLTRPGIGLEIKRADAQRYAV